ncbi:MAG TPA: tetratricopeptide repeat protein, partial [Fimbriimonadaceae bacterium]|nr:tetratricopeptide repeat protein [Fimbriimonadaceae bacterium]
TPPVKPEDSKWSADAAAALKAGDMSRAINILRDAVDSSPMDVARRILLIKTLTQASQPEVAAREARRAAELMPDHIEFRALAATAWIQAGNIDEAQTDLNEAVSRAPDSPETRLLLANVAIAKGDFPTAIGHLDKAIAASPTGDAYYLRGLAHAMSGENDLADADVKKAVDLGLSQDPQEAEERYRLVATIFDNGLTQIGGEIRTLHSRAQVDRTDKDVKAAFDDLMKRVAGRVRFISSLPTPPAHELSHNRRVLAYKLLSQCLTDLESYLKSGDVDVLTDSRINLGEALKQGVSAREEFKNEQQRTKKSDGKPG